MFRVTFKLNTPYSVVNVLLLNDNCETTRSSFFLSAVTESFIVQFPTRGTRTGYLNLIRFGLVFFYRYAVKFEYSNDYFPTGVHYVRFGVFFAPFNLRAGSNV